MEEALKTKTLGGSYAEAAAKNLTQNLDEKLLGNIVTEAKNSERIQEHERTKRENNIIIYGANVNNDMTDAEYIVALFDILGVAVQPQATIRLGKVDENQNGTRPLKLVMKTTADKSQIMSRLVNLRDADDKFRKISVRDDYSFEERHLIKQWADKAAAKNKEENTSEYKIRGNPKNGLRLVRVTKRSRKDEKEPPAQTTEMQ